MMKNKEDIINKIIKENRYKVYLEIGYGTGYNYRKISPRLNKDAVDPAYTGNHNAVYAMNSDEFFAQNEQTYDLIFIDGLHHADQVRKDISNALKCLSKDGCIILHDTIPHSKEMQEVPRTQKIWTGDCWRAAVGFIESYPDVRVETYRSDYGLTVLYPEGKKTRKYFEDTEMSYEYFKKNAVELLRIID